MELSYHLSEDDALALHKKALSKGIFFKKYIFLIALLFALVLRAGFGPSHYTYSHRESTFTSSSYTTSTHETSYWVDICTNLAYALIVIFIVRFVSISRGKKFIHNNRDWLGKRRIELDNDKLILYTDKSKSEIDLSAFKKFEETKNHYYLYVTRDIAQIIIPKSQSLNSPLIEELRARIPAGK